MTCRTYPCTSWTQKIWPANSADSRLFMKIDWHTALMSYNQPAFRQDVKWILTFLYKQRRTLHLQGWQGLIFHTTALWLSTTVANIRRSHQSTKKQSLNNHENSYILIFFMLPVLVVTNVNCKSYTDLFISSFYRSMVLRLKDLWVSNSHNQNHIQQWTFAFLSWHSMPSTNKLTLACVQHFYEALKAAISTSLCLPLLYPQYQTASCSHSNGKCSKPYI